MVYGEQDGELSTSKYSGHPICGQFAVLKSAGPNPFKEFIIRSFTKEIKEMKGVVLTLVKPNKLLVFFKPRFNFLEIKIYLGDNMLNIVDGKTKRNIKNEPLSTGCNKLVNVHNDL